MYKYFCEMIESDCYLLVLALCENEKCITLLSLRQQLVLNHEIFHVIIFKRSIRKVSDKVKHFEMVIFISFIR